MIKGSQCLGVFNFSLALFDSFAHPSTLSRTHARTHARTHIMIYLKLDLDLDLDLDLSIPVLEPNPMPP